MKFIVKLGDEIIGSSEFEYGDPSMGCASGRFLEAPGYATIKQYCIDHSPDWVPIPGLMVSTPDGTTIECVGGIQIMDIGEEYREISICGITHPPYAQLFPEHWAEHYKNRKP